MGAKDWMLMYADGDVAPILRAAPAIDRAATRDMVARLYPAHRLVPIHDGTLDRNANPPDGHVYAACLPGLTVVCSGDVALGRPSELPGRWLDEGKGRTIHLHAMHSVVDWFAYAIWTGAGELSRSLSLSPDSGIIENIGRPLAFEADYWAGEHPVEVDEDDEGPYPLPFHPLELAEDALRALFGLNYEGYCLDGDPDLGKIRLSGYVVDPV